MPCVPRYLPDSYLETFFMLRSGGPAFCATAIVAMTKSPARTREGIAMPGSSPTLYAIYYDKYEKTALDIIAFVRGYAPVAGSSRQF